MSLIKPEQLFLKYSYPCAHVLLEMGSITESKLEELKENVIKNKVMLQSELESLFPAAFRRIKEVAKKMNKTYWNVDVIRKYFLEEHNNYIDERDGGYADFGKTFREFCKVFKGTVVSKNENMLTVVFENQQRNVFSDILPKAEIGDIVTIHQGFAVEKFD